MLGERMERATISPILMPTSVLFPASPTAALIPCHVVKITIVVNNPDMRLLTQQTALAPTFWLDMLRCHQRQCR